MKFQRSRRICTVSQERRPPLLTIRLALAKIVWQYTVRRIKADTIHDYNVAWGKARQDFYALWGPLPCPLSEIRRLRSLQNQFAGHRIFIIGNGPSLNCLPLDRLVNEYTFGVNRIYLLFDRITWRPTFYTAVDWLVVPDVAHEINALEDMTFFFPQRFRGLLRTGDDVFWFWKRTGMTANIDRSIDERFAYDITTGVRSGGSVIVTAIQIAAYLGFDPIYLIGVDADYKVLPTVRQSGPDLFDNSVLLNLQSTQDDDPNHFDPRYFGKDRWWRNPNVPEMIKGFQNCHDALQAQGRRIYNATYGGRLEVFERVDFKSLF